MLKLGCINVQTNKDALSAYVWVHILFLLVFQNFVPCSPILRKYMTNLYSLQLLLPGSVKMGDLSKSKRCSSSESPVCSVDILKQLDLYLEPVADCVSLGPFLGVPQAHTLFQAPTTITAIYIS